MIIYYKNLIELIIMDINIKKLKTKEDIIQIDHL